MTKYYCDKCGTELKDKDYFLIFEHDGIPATDIKTYDLCINCYHAAKEFFCAWMETNETL